MVRAKVTSKGQVTIPKEVRDRLGIEPGDELVFVEEDGATVIRKEIRESPFREYRGYLKHLAGRDSDEVVDEMRGR